MDQATLAIALTAPPFSILTYGVPEGFTLDDFPVGLRVLVPVGRQLRVGIVWERGAPPPEGITVRPALWPLERTPACDALYLDLVRNLATRYLSPPGRILMTLLPKGLRTSRMSFSCISPNGLPQRLTAQGLTRCTPEGRATLIERWRAGDMACQAEAGTADPLCSLAVDPPWPVRPGAAKQIEVLETLCDQGSMPVSGLRERLGAGVLPTLRRLADLGLVRVENGEGERAGASTGERNGVAETPPDQPLTADQQQALAALSEALAAPDGAPRLVFGVTGSGKTRLYMELTKLALEAGKRVLLLAPEVALAARLQQAARKAFPEREVLFSHGYQPPAMREAAFCRMARPDAPAIVAGTRSALLLPVRDVGLIVLDEEHDGAFKQEDRLPYQAKEVAFFRARQAGALLVLGSATPDVKTFQAARLGQVPMVCLPRRVGGGGLPEIELVDLRGAAKVTAVAGERETGDRLGILTDRASQALRETVAAGDQAMILLNRRGYAPLLYCLDCETPVRCPRCELSLTYHKDRERLVCHYCGYSQPHPTPCPSCGGTSFLPMGVGAELLAEQLTGALPDGTTVLRLDRDIARRPERAEAILADFAAGRGQVLVGTQMLSKGHHFPDVTLVVVADADLGRNLPDYRAEERTFQLLTQVAGRAGRGERPGRVLIQTRAPEDAFFQYVIANDFEGFFELELSRRRRLWYPPFTHLGLVRLSYAREDETGAGLVAAVGDAMRKAAAPLDVRVLGPAPAPLSLLAGRRRMHCLMKSPDWLSLRRVFAVGREALGSSGRVRMTLDLDPVDML